MTTIGYTAGVFDLFHIGHLRLLEAAAKQCDHLIVALTTDELSTTFKGKTPVIPWAERAAIVNALDCVDEVMPQHTMDRYGVWKDRHFDITFVGDDWEGSALWAGYEKRFAKVGVEVVYLPYSGGTSSTLLRAALTALTEPTSSARGVPAMAAA